MANQRKNVQFDHFRPYYLKRNDDGSTQECAYDLKALLQYVASQPFTNTKKQILGDTHMFHVCKRDGQLKVWELQVLHLREKLLPGIADDAGAYELITLEENQYPAESTTMLYDEVSCTLYMQRNIYGTSIKAFEEFLQRISPEGTLVLLKPIICGKQIAKITTGKLYRKCILAVDSEQLTEEQRTQSLGRIIDDFRRYQGRIVKIDLGFGRKRKGLLNSGEISSLVHEAYNYPGTQNLSVSVSEDEDTAFETINLLDDRASYKVTIEFSRGNPITHERLYKTCLGEFREEHEP